MSNTHSIDLETSSTQYASKSSPTGLPSGSGNRTIEAWIKPETLGTTNIFIVDQGEDGTNNSEFNLAYKYSSGNYYGFVDFYNRGITGTVDLGFVVGEWNHYAVTFDGTDCRFYVNGILVDTVAKGGTVDTVNTTLRIGRRVTGGTCFDGLIQDVRIWDDVRTASEIQDNIGAYTLASETNLQGRWLFNNDATDETANGNDLTLSGSPVYSNDIAYTGALVGVFNDLALARGVRSYYDFEETSGTRADGIGATGFDLADNNTVGYATGKQGNGADFNEASSEYLNVDSGDDDDFHDDDGSISVWIKYDSVDSSNSGIVADWDLNPYKKLILQLETNNTLYFARGGSTNSIADSTTTLSTGTWYHVVATWKNGEKSKLYINGVLDKEGASALSGINNGASNGIQIGGYSYNGSASGRYFDGVMDELIFYNRVISAGEVHNLYNGGSGLPKQDATIDAIDGHGRLDNPQLKAYYTLDEASSTRVDSHGAHDLTDNNTVGQATGKIEDCASFVGANSETLSVPDHSDFDIGANDFGISFWAYWPTSVDGAPVISKSNYSSNRSYRLYDFDSASTRWRISTTGSNDVDVFSVSTASAISPDTWHHIVITRIDGVTKLYIDNTLITSVTDSNTYYNGNGAFTIGGDNAGDYLDARVDELAFQNGRGYDLADIESLYNGGSGLKYSGSTSASYAPSSPLGITFSLPSSQVNTDSNIAIASPLGVTFSIPSSSASSGTVRAIASPLDIYFSLMAPSISAGGNVTLSPASPLGITFSIPSATASGDSSVAVAQPLGITFAVQSVSVGLGQTLGIASPLEVTFSLNSPYLVFPVTFTPSSPLGITFSIPAYTVKTGITVGIASPLSLTFSLPQESVYNDISIAVASPLGITFTIPEIDVDADFWQDKYPVNETGRWTDKY